VTDENGLSYIEDSESAQGAPTLVIPVQRHGNFHLGRHELQHMLHAGAAARAERVGPCAA